MAHRGQENCQTFRRSSKSLCSAQLLFSRELLLFLSRLLNLLLLNPAQNHLLSSYSLSLSPSLSYLQAVNGKNRKTPRQKEQPSLRQKLSLSLPLPFAQE